MILAPSVLNCPPDGFQAFRTAGIGDRHKCERDYRRFRNRAARSREQRKVGSQFSSGIRDRSQALTWSEKGKHLWAHPP